MHVSRRWLARHCAFLQNIDAAELARELSLSTCEVEGVQRFAPALSDVTIGFVAERAPHPDSDHLSLTKVDVGSGELLQIVCGAPNVAQGQKVAVATIGTTLPGDFKIKKSKIRGVESQGMICSERELGLGDEHNGIWVLPSDAQVGKRVAEALDLVDWVLEIDNKSLTHRPDLWGHRGIARELAAIYGKTLEPLASALPAQGNAKPYAVRVESEKCSRYLALPIDGVKTGRSPEWMRHLLLAVGQRPIELLVDLSNFVMLDLGQPNHLFDRARLRGEPIVVRQARAAERMQTLDGVERNLVTTDLLICAGENPVALAGVMGGEQSKVGAETRELLLEVASFDPACVRRTSSRLGLRTDASARFEKNLSPTLALEATGHLVNLLRELQPEIKLPAPLTDAGKWKDPARKISLRTDVVRRRLGVNVEQLSDAKIVEILQRLELRCEGRDGVLTVDIPSIRATKDLTIEQDLVEEVGRIFRYGNVPEARLEGSLAPPPPDAKRVLVRKLEDRLAGVGRFRQTLSYSFVADASLAKLGLSELPHSSVINPVAEGLTRIRRGVAPSLLAPLEPNRRHSKDVRLFEIGKGYSPDGANEPREVHELALVIAREPSAANAKFDDNAFAFLRGAVDDVCFALRLEAPTYTKLARVDGAPYLHPGKTLAVRIGEREIGWLAALDPRVERELGLAGELKSDVALATLSLDALVATPTREKIYRSLPRFPGVKIDVALALPTGVAAEDVRVALERAGKGLARDIELFDVYTGPNAGPGRKSLAYHVYLESDERTLTDQDSQKFLQRVEREATTLGGELRKA
ncbi:MAG: phenylalanine--tRNA ligase subunit beta [Planctomycetes bacterium]|nr:phenylalanine--tRNA ligase subunit beta [Planctomycetota bacterium]